MNKEFRKERRCMECSMQGSDAGSAYASDFCFSDVVTGRWWGSRTTGGRWSSGNHIFWFQPHCISRCRLFSVGVGVRLIFCQPCVVVTALSLLLLLALRTPLLSKKLCSITAGTPVTKPLTKTFDELSFMCTISLHVCKPSFGQFKRKKIQISLNMVCQYLTPDFSANLFLGSL